VIVLLLLLLRIVVDVSSSAAVGCWFHPWSIPFRFLSRLVLASTTQRSRLTKTVSPAYARLSLQFNGKKR
jgi:hypothetical protein